MKEFKEKEEEYTPYNHDTVIAENAFKPNIVPGVNAIPEQFRGSVRDFELPYFLGLFVGQPVPINTDTIIVPTTIRTNLSVNPYDIVSNEIVIPSDGIYEIKYNISPVFPTTSKSSKHFIVVGSTTIAYFETQFTQTIGQTSMGVYVGNFKYNDRVKVKYTHNAGAPENVYGFICLTKVA